MSRKKKSTSPPRRVDWREASRLYLKEKLSYSEVAWELDFEQGTIRKGLLARGVPRHPLGVQNWGKHGNRLYNVWRSIRQRCENPDAKGYEYFGGKGITVCRDWQDFEVFHAWALATGYKPGLSLSRKNHNRGHMPSNCEWLPKDEVSRRTQKRTEIASYWTIVAFGEEKGPTEWSRDPRCKVSVTALIRRIDQGMDPELAISQPGVTVRGASEMTIAAFGETKSPNSWGRDPRCRVSVKSLLLRIERGFSPEDAISVPPRFCRGTRKRASRKRKT